MHRTLPTDITELDAIRRQAEADMERYADVADAYLQAAELRRTVLEAIHDLANRPEE